MRILEVQEIVVEDEADTAVAEAAAMEAANNPDFFIVAARNCDSTNGLAVEKIFDEEK